MPVIAHVEGVLNAAPKPVICLDTCDILEVVQCLDWEKPGGNTPRSTSCIEPVRRLLETLTANPNRAQLIPGDQPLFFVFPGPVPAKADVKTKNKG
jgi:hypothetical protein